MENETTDNSIISVEKQQPDQYKENYNQEEHEDKRHARNIQIKRFTIIRNVLWFSFGGFILYILLVIIDSIYWKSNLADKSSMVVFVTTLSSILTTALGVIIGSSID